MLTDGSLALANAKLLLHADSADQDQRLRTGWQTKCCCKGDCIAMLCVTRRELCAEIHQELGPLAGALDLLEAADTFRPALATCYVPEEMVQPHGAKADLLTPP